jgi:hypothetical protein
MSTYQTQSIDTRFGQYNGTKTNSDYFWHYLRELYDWRQSTGLNDNFEFFSHITTQVDTGKRQEAVLEFVTMQGYDFSYSFENDKYICSVLEYTKDKKVPKVLIREVKEGIEPDVFWFMNQVAPNRVGTNSRYIGEVLAVKNIQDLFEVLEKAGVHFMTNSIQGSKEEGQKYVETYPSAYTQNTVRYVEYSDLDNPQIHLNTDKIFQEDDDFLKQIKKIKENQKEQGVLDLMGPLDHIATRVMSQDRENAILEIVKLAPYYPWGAYNIEEQNSSTNPTRNIYHADEKYFPAKVFTAGNNGFVVNFLEDIYNTTDIYAYNFGRSLHHLAFSIPDFGDGSFNIDKVVDFVVKIKPEMAGELFGDRKEGLRQIFMKRSRIFGWATEYIQRFDNYHGFFTRQNVANLTGALKDDEKRK